MTLSVSKSALRAEIRRLVAGIDAQRRRTEAEAVAGLLSADPHYAEARRVLVYWPLPDELDLTGWILRESEHKQFFLPVVENGEMAAAPMTGRWREGAYHIQEPDSAGRLDPSLLDLVVVPGRAFDIQGRRLGRGKGYYDRFLPKTTAYKIGVCFDCQLVESVPTDGFDLPVDKVYFCR